MQCHPEKDLERVLGAGPADERPQRGLRRWETALRPDVREQMPALPGARHTISMATTFGGRFGKVMMVHRLMRTTSPLAS